MGAFLTLIPLFSTLLDKLIPDKGAADAAKLEFLRMAQAGELAQLTANTSLAQGQIEVNKVEAASPSLFVAGWRPAIGWLCALALGFKFIGGPLMMMVGAYAGIPVQLPAIDSGELMPLLFGMLGLGAMRTVEKIKGAA